MLTPVLHGTGFSWAHRAHPFSLHVDHVDMFDANKQGWGVPLESITTSEMGANGVSSMTFRYEDPLKRHSLPAAARTRFTQWIGSTEAPLFAGYITGRRTVPFGGDLGYAIDVTVGDYSLGFDWHILPAFKHKAGASDKTLIQAVVAAAMRNHDINTHSGFVVSTNSNMDAVDFSFMTLRAAIEAIQSMAGADRHYYVDFFGRLHYFSGVEASTPAPFTIDQVTPSTGIHRAPENLELEYDDSQIINAVYVRGGNKVGTGWVKDETSIKRYGLRQAAYDAPHSKSATARNNVGNHFLARHKDPIVRGQFQQSGTDTGWSVGQSVVATHAGLSISGASYPIKQIDTTYQGGTGHRTRTIYIGDLPARGRRAPRALSPVGVATTGPSPLAAPQPAIAVAGTFAGFLDLEIL